MHNESYVGAIFYTKEVSTRTQERVIISTSDSASAYLSLKRNMPYSWTWYDHIEKGIPNTNNSLEGQFANLKTKLRNHNGLSMGKRRLFIDQYFKASFDK